jgi:hypothetical protein
MYSPSRKAPERISLTLQISFKRFLFIHLSSFLDKSKSSIVQLKSFGTIFFPSSSEA